MASKQCKPGEEQKGIERFLGEHLALLKSNLSFSGYERDLLALNLGGKGFRDLSGLSGVDSMSDGRAAVYVDYDNDGDTDIFLRAMHGRAHYLFRNEIGAENRWLRIAVAGPPGAEVTVKTGAGLVTRLAACGAGFLAQHDPRLLFGLGADEACEWIEVRWPGGKRQRLPGAKAGSFLRIPRPAE